MPPKKSRTQTKAAQTPSEQEDEVLGKPKSHKGWRPLSTYVVEDIAEMYRIVNDQIFNVPFKIGVYGPSDITGKTTMVVNLLCRDEFYNQVFQGEHIYLVCPSFDTDNKWQRVARYKGIPPENIMRTYDERVISGLILEIEEKYHKAIEEGELPDYCLFVFDDCGYKGILHDSKKESPIKKLFMNSRHANISTIVTAQAYVQVWPEMRKNMTGAIIFGECPAADIEIFHKDTTSKLPKKDFLDIMAQYAEEPRSYIVFNKTNPPDKRFMDSKWQPIPELN